MILYQIRLGLESFVTKVHDKELVNGIWISVLGDQSYLKNFTCYLVRIHSNLPYNTCVT